MDFREFAYRGLPMRVVFGPKSIERLPDEVRDLGLRRLLVLATPEQREDADRVARALGDHVVGVHAEARMHVPIGVAQRASAVAEELGADGCVAVGGGSTTGLAKAIALHSGLPIIAVPTTYAGSEMTPVWGLTEHRQKRTGKDTKVLPSSVIYDPELTLSLPVDTAVTSGMNAMAHAVESLYAPDASPIISLMAEEAVRSMCEALPRIAAEPSDLAARSDALYGAWLCGACLGATTMSLHHKLCHVLGGAFDLPHAETHAVVLPHALAYNAPAAPTTVRILSRALGGGDPAEELHRLATDLGAPTSLESLGLQRSDIDRAVALVTQNAYANPREVTANGVHDVLTAAFEGRPPTRSGN